MVDVSCGSIKWPAQQIGVKSENQVAADGGAYNFGSGHVLYGVQSLGYDANIDPQVIFQIGQGAIYDIDDGLPTVDITVNKALDGYCPVFLAATRDATEPTLLARAPTKANFGISYFDCTKDSARGSAEATVVLKDVQVTSVGYTLGVDGVFSEDISFTGNNIIWSTTDSSNPIYAGATINPDLASIVSTIQFDGQLENNDLEPNPKAQFKEDFIFDYSGFSASTFDSNGAVCDGDITVLPPEIYGIAQNGLNSSGICIQSISFSADLTREDIFCLGQRQPSNRTLTLPIQVDTTVDVVSETGAQVSFYEDGTFIDPNGYGVGSVCGDFGTNRQDRTIRVATCGGLRISTGTKNFLVGVSTTGGSTDGDDLTVSYTFRAFNVLTVLHQNDVNSSGSDWWTNREDYVCGN